MLQRLHIIQHHSRTRTRCSSCQNRLELCPRLACRSLFIVDPREKANILYNLTMMTNSAVACVSRLFRTFLVVVILSSVLEHCAAGRSRSPRTNESNTDIGFSRNIHRIPEGNWPHFFIVGAPKSATTSLYRLFASKHPRICSSYTKEVHYFDREESWKKGSAFYSAHFSVKSNLCEKKMSSLSNSNMTVKDMAFMDSTPGYFANYLAPARMHAAFSKKDRPKKRFILVLREPVAREYSWYNHRARFCTTFMHSYIQAHRNKRQVDANGKPIWDTKKMCAEEHCKALDCVHHATNARLNREVEAIANFTEYYEFGGLVPVKSEYMTHLDRWLQFFDRSQFFIVSYETLLANTTDTVQRMTQFLGIGPFQVAKGKEIVLPHENTARVETKFDCAVRDALHPYYEPHNQRLYEYLERTSNYSGITYEPPFVKFVPQLCPDPPK